MTAMRQNSTRWWKRLRTYLTLETLEARTPPSESMGPSLTLSSINLARAHSAPPPQLIQLTNRLGEFPAVATNPLPFWQATAPAEAERAAGPAYRSLAPAASQAAPRPALNLPGPTDDVLAATELLLLDLSSSSPRSQHPGTHFVSSGTVSAGAAFDAGTSSALPPDAGAIAGLVADTSTGPSPVSPGSVSQDTASLLALVNFIPVGGGSPGSGNHHDGAPAGPGGNGGGGGDGRNDIKRDPPGGRGRKSNDPLWVLDVNNGLVLTGGETIHDFSGWTVDLYAQVSGASLSATDYRWDTHLLAPDATNVTVTSGYHLQFTWATFCGADKADTISITTNPGQSPITQTFYFTIYAQTIDSCQGSPAWSTPTPRPFGTNVFPLLVPPDAVLADQQTIDRQYYSLGEATGEVMTHFTLPSYHPAVAPLQLDYSSLAADPRPIFTEYYQLSQTPTSTSKVTATLKLNGVSQGTSTYDTHLLNFGDILAIALQGDATGLNTGRYPYEIDVTENSTVQTPQTGSVDIVNSANSPFGAGWSLDNLEHLTLPGGCTSPTGALVELPGGKSLWYAYNAGSFVAPPGDFSTFVINGS
jgi:hypothetical protein